MRHALGCEPGKVSPAVPQSVSQFVAGSRGRSVSQSLGRSFGLFSVRLAALAPR